MLGICVLGLISAGSFDHDFEQYFGRQFGLSFRHLISSIDHPSISPGAMVASPSKEKPDYFYHWVRDAGLMTDVLVRVFLGTADPDRRESHFRRLNFYIHFLRRPQNSPAPAGLGEPKFFLDGKVFDGPWGRPQNDGPAVRALPMMVFAEALLRVGETDYVRDFLYSPELPATTLIKKDLEYVAHHWGKRGFDLWEEVNGLHFYTLMLQRAALSAGVDLAQQLDDDGAAEFYQRDTYDGVSTDSKGPCMVFDYLRHGRIPLSF